MQKITPFLWFEHNAEDAVDFYTATFANASTQQVARYGEEGPGEPGSVMTIAFQLEGYAFTAINGGPYTSFTPAVSFFVACESQSEIDRLWERLSAEGQILMPLDAYPFSPRFGWVEDQFGVSWQLTLASSPHKITPCLMYVGARHGQAEAALRHYTALFEQSSITSLDRYGPDEGDMAGSVRLASFLLYGQQFYAMDSGHDHAFTMTPAISFFVNCTTQAELDRLWESLSDGGEIQQCGWLVDRYGVTWQIVPNALLEMMQDPDPEKAARVTHAMLQMTKIDVPTLEAAYAGS